MVKCLYVLEKSYDIFVRCIWNFVWNTQKTNETGNSKEMVERKGEMKIHTHTRTYEYRAQRKKNCHTVSLHMVLFVYSFIFSFGSEDKSMVPFHSFIPSFFLSFCSFYWFWLLQYFIHYFLKWITSLILKYQYMHVWI